MIIGIQKVVGAEKSPRETDAMALIYHALPKRRIRTITITRTNGEIKGRIIAMRRNAKKLTSVQVAIAFETI